MQVGLVVVVDVLAVVGGDRVMLAVQSRQPQQRSGDRLGALFGVFLPFGRQL